MCSKGFRFTTLHLTLPLWKRFLCWREGMLSLWGRWTRWFAEFPIHGLILAYQYYCCPPALVCSTVITILTYKKIRYCEDLLGILSPRWCCFSPCQDSHPYYFSLLYRLLWGSQWGVRVAHWHWACLDAAKCLTRKQAYHERWAHDHCGEPNRIKQCFGYIIRTPL